MLLKDSLCTSCEKLDKTAQNRQITTERNEIKRLRRWWGSQDQWKQRLRAKTTATRNSDDNPEK